MSEFRHSCALRPETATNWTSFRCCGRSGGGGRGEGRKAEKLGLTVSLQGVYADHHRHTTTGPNHVYHGGALHRVVGGALISQWMIKRYYLHGFSVDCPEERAAPASREGSLHSLKGPRVHDDHEFQRF